MKKIGLIDVDGHNFPNLALMKISAFHKRKGDIVEWVNYFERYDKVYASKVFTFTPDVTTVIQAGEVVKGGTGYDASIVLPSDIENMQPDYSTYPNTTCAYGFLTRGCIRCCPWCIVPQKEGTIRDSGDIEEILQGRNAAILMDNNILASEHGIKQLKKIAEIGCRVDFNQGLDARLVTEEVAEILSKIRWIQYIRFAFDSASQFVPLIKALTLLNRNGVSNHKIFVYVLLRDFADSYKRITACKTIKVIPFAQPYRDFTPNQHIPKWQQDMAHWCNRKELFKSIDFRDFMPRKGFYCEEYFKM
jgi:hypothetical protein